MATASALEDARGSSVRRASEPARASERLWDLHWAAWSIGDVGIEPCAFADAMPFIGEHYPRIFPTGPSRFFEEKMSTSKRRFYAECDSFLFRASGAVVGVCICHPTDWSTYYLRTVAILPGHRGRGIFRAFVDKLCETLRAHDVERFELETAPNNIAMNRSMLALGGVVTSTSNTERWGAMLRYTRYLAADPARVFERQFIAVPVSGGETNRSQQEGEGP